MNHIEKRVAFYSKLFLKNKTQIFFFLLLITFIFLRFYELPQRALLGWDQADSAWAARSILLENPLRMEGVPIKGNTSMFMGPLYYYLITPFYFFTSLDMIAAPIFASVISVFNFLIFYNITKKLFDTSFALLASFIYTFSLLLISADRLQAAYVLIPIVSYIVFYFLYKFILGEEKYILYLGAIIGFGFHIHFTAVFYLLIVLLTLPLFPRTKKSFIYSLISISILLLFISPMLYSIFLVKSSESNGIVSYLNMSYHGFHLKRFLQLIHDGFISFESIMQFHILRPISLLLLPLFIVIFNLADSKKTRKERLVLSYLMGLFVLVPWVIFSTYNGELTDYYFSHSRYLAIVVIAFLFMFLYKRNVLLVKLLVISISIFYACNNLYLFFRVLPGNYFTMKQSVESTIQSNKLIEYKERDPIFYTYFIYTHDKKR